MLKCLKEFSDCDPSGAETAEHEIWQEMCDAAGVNLDTLKAARAIVNYDGQYGPQTDLDYQNLGYSLSQTEAFRIVKEALDVRFSDVEFCNHDYEYEEDQDGNSLPNYIIRGRDIYNEIWDFYFKIYGR